MVMPGGWNDCDFIGAERVDEPTHNRGAKGRTCHEAELVNRQNSRQLVLGRGVLDNRPAHGDGHASPTGPRQIQSSEKTSCGTLVIIGRMASEPKSCADQEQTGLGA